MGIEWFRDLSITVLGFVATVVLIFGAILAYRLYQTIKSTMLKVREASQKACDTVVMVQEGIKPLLEITSVIRFVIEGVKSLINMFKKESHKGGNNNE
jgi:hypothetical protein